MRIATTVAGLDNMRDPGILDPRHFFSPGTFTRFTRFLHNFTRFYMIFAQFSMIFAQFYANFAIFTRFFVIFTRFLRFLRDFCDFYAIFCQAKILASQAPKTIIQACQPHFSLFQIQLFQSINHRCRSCFLWCFQLSTKCIYFIRTNVFLSEPSGADLTLGFSFFLFFFSFSFPHYEETF